MYRYSAVGVTEEMKTIFITFAFEEHIITDDDDEFSLYPKSSASVFLKRR